MWKKGVGGLVVIGALFFTYVSSQDDHFKYERRGVIKVSAEKIFPYLTDFKLGEKWSPYEKEKGMPKSYGGNSGQVGSWMKFGPSQSGSGQIEITEIIPNQTVKLNLHMTEPFEANNTVVYQLTPQAEGVEFSWSMEGRSGFMGKLLAVFIDCEKMVGNQFTEGIENLRALMESENINSKTLTK